MAKGTHHLQLRVEPYRCAPSVTVKVREVRREADRSERDEICRFSPGSQSTVSKHTDEDKARLTKLTRQDRQLNLWRKLLDEAAWALEHSQPAPNGATDRLARRIRSALSQ